MHTWSGSCASGRALKGNRAAPLKSRCRGPFVAPLCKNPEWKCKQDKYSHIHPVMEIMSWFSYCTIFLEHKWLGTIHYNSNYFKGIVYPKMKVTPWFTHPQSILDILDFILSDEYNLSCINVLNFPSFIMVVNSGRDFEALNVHLSIIKSAPHGSGG